MENKGESFLDHLPEDYGKKSPSKEDREERAAEESSGEHSKPSSSDLMIDSLEAEFDMNEIDEDFLNGEIFDDIEEVQIEQKSESRIDGEEGAERSSVFDGDLQEELPVPEEKFSEAEASLHERKEEEALKQEKNETLEKEEELDSREATSTQSPESGEIIPSEESSIVELSPTYEEDLFDSETAKKSEIMEEDRDEESGEMNETIGIEDLFSELESSDHPGDKIDEILRFDDNINLDEISFEDDGTSHKEATKTPSPSKKKKGIFGFFTKLFSNVPLTEEEIKAIPTPEEALELKKQKEEDSKKKKEEKKAKSEANKKAKAEEAKKKAADAKAKKKAKDEAKKEAKKNAELRRLRAEAALPPEGKINKAGAMIIILFFLLLGMVVIFGSSIISYDFQVYGARQKFEHREYNEAFDKIRGVKVKEKDMDIHNKIYTVMFVNKQLNSYNNYYAMGDYAGALDSLIKGLYRYDKYIAYATQLGIKSDLNYVRKQIIAEFQDSYQMTERDALVLMGIVDKKEYSETIYKTVSKMEKEAKKAQQEKKEEETKEFVP